MWGMISSQLGVGANIWPSYEKGPAALTRRAEARLMLFGSFLDDVETVALQRLSLKAKASNPLEEQLAFNALELEAVCAAIAEVDFDP
jgi:hypothetical protein